MEYLIGAILGLGACILGTLAGFERDRAYYPVMTIVVATYYDLFAVMGGSSGALVAEILITSVFVVAAILGFRRNLWIAAGALIGHGVMDIFHHRLVSDPGVPPYWPMFCMTFDIVAGLYLAWRLMGSRIRARADVP